MSPATTLRQPGDDLSPLGEDLSPLGGLDPGIAPYVEVLRRAGVETFESCEGGEGHCFPEPTIRFYGQRDEGFRALAVALQRAFPVSNLRRVWSIEDGEPVGPNWELTFYRQAIRV